MPTLSIEKYPQEGDLTHTYGALRNMLNNENEIVGFNTDEVEVDLNNPLNIECQPSYDGTVNLIINDDIHPPRIINSRFSKIEDNRFKIINRNQKQQTNLYKEGSIDQQTRLFRNITTFPKIDLLGVYNSGQLKGGNYTFYFKYADEDYNKTDFVAESGMVSIFKGQIDNIASISGTLDNELTDKAITLRLSNLDRAYSKLYIYYTKDTSDTNGVRYTSAYMINDPYSIQHNTEDITITGYEDVSEVSIEEINLQYNLVTAAKTQAQVQNMLFLGNTQGVNLNLKDLQNLSYFIKVTLKQDDNVGFVNPKDYYYNILLQFLLEAMVIGIVGGGLGVLLGVGASFAISYFAGWNTVISLWAIIIAVVFSIGIGLFFGIYPARKAALLDPIDALRYE